jgi:hypothetical protein
VLGVEGEHFELKVAHEGQVELPHQIENVILTRKEDRSDGIGTRTWLGSSESQDSDARRFVDVDDFVHVGVAEDESWNPDLFKKIFWTIILIVIVFFVF